MVAKRPEDLLFTLFASVGATSSDSKADPPALRAIRMTIGINFAEMVVLYVKMTSIRARLPKRFDHGTRLALFATLLVAAVLVVVTGLQRFGPSAAVIRHQQSWNAVSLSGAGAVVRLCHAVLARATTCTTHGHRASAARPFAPSCPAWIDDATICVSEPSPSSSRAVVRAAAALTHDATGPPLSLQA